MFGLTTDAVGRAALRAASRTALCLLAMGAGMAAAKAETRTLKIYHLHTHEKEEIAYKRDGRYLPEGLKKINWILRDWRKQTPINMDPRLLDLVWEAYRQSGSRSYISVICGYRSAETNGMLRSRTAGVAKESQHVLGKALDFTLPDVSLAKLRAIGLKMQIGGVGFYPKSGSPFVHFDVGNVRHWPKMSRKELLAVFPNGNTLHVPSDGKPLPGYEQALASYKSRKTSTSIQVANAGAAPASIGGGGGGKTLLAMLFGGGADEEEDTAEAEATTKAPAAKATAKTEAPAEKVPAKASEEITAVAALVPAKKPGILPSGVPLPIRDTFDTSAPKTMVPPAAIANEAKPQEVEVAALDPARVPLPTAAPAREPILVAEAVKVPVPSAPANAPQAGDTSLVAALATPPSPEDVAAKEAGQLAYSVPMPRSRPPFESILHGETPQAKTVDEVRAIVETANADAPQAKPVPASALTVLASNHPIAQPRSAPNHVIVASLEQAKRTSAAIKPAAVPTGKTARFKRQAQPTDLAMAFAPNVVHASQAAIAARIRMADLVTDPNKRHEVSNMVPPDAGGLVRNAPTAVLATGFASRPDSQASDRFAGSAVNFMPVVKVD